MYVISAPNTSHTIRMIDTHCILMLTDNSNDDDNDDGDDYQCASQTNDAKAEKENELMMD